MAQLRLRQSYHPHLHSLESMVNDQEQTQTLLNLLLLQMVTFQVLLRFTPCFIQLVIKKAMGMDMLVDQGYLLFLAQPLLFVIYLKKSFRVF